MGMNQDFLYQPDKLAEMFLNQYHIWNPDAEGCKAEELQFVRGQADWTLKWWRGGFYIWLNGRYTPIDDENLSALVTRFLQDINRMPFNPPDPPIRITTGLVRNILRNLSGFEGVYISDLRELNTWLKMEDGRQTTDDGTITISFMNGLLIFSNSSNASEFVKHTPKYFSLARLPYNYDKNAQCPRWQAFLDDVMQGDSQRIKLLQEWAGYLLTNTLQFQKFMLLAGEGGNGKTVFTTMQEKMVGEENACHVPLARFGESFALSPTLGKMLNTSSESSHRIDELVETALKSYTSGDRMTFDRKFREPLNTHPTAKVMMSTNQLPNFTDKSNGVWRRLLFVPFDKCVPTDEQNPELVRELTAELPGIFNWAYQGLRKLMADGQFIEPERCKEAISEYRRDTNPAKVFLEENYSMLSRNA
jgi:P4 family phage/plasmid primase-like protien